MLRSPSIRQALGVLLSCQPSNRLSVKDRTNPWAVTSITAFTDVSIVMTLTTIPFVDLSHLPLTMPPIAVFWLAYAFTL